MLEIVLTPKILGPPEIGGPRLKPFQPNGKSAPGPPTRLPQLRTSLLCQQRQVAKLASRLLYSWSLLRNNNMAINRQMFTSSYGSRRFTACDQGSH